MRIQIFLLRLSNRLKDNLYETVLFKTDLLLKIDDKFKINSSKHLRVSMATSLNETLKKQLKHDWRKIFCKFVFFEDK